MPKRSPRPQSLSRWVRSHAWLCLWAVAAVQFVAIAVSQTIWSRVDEAQHFHFVEYLAEHRSLPVMGQTFISQKVVQVSLIVDQWGWNPPRTVYPPENLDPREWQTVPRGLEEEEERQEWVRQNLWYFSYEAMQPPLYYALGVLLYWLLPDDPFLQIYALRGLSALLASLTVAVAYFTMKEAFPRYHVLPLAAALTVALIPGFSLNLSQVTNDSLATLLSSFCLYLLVRGVRRGIGWAQLALIGLTIGLSLLTKLTTAYLIPVALVGVILATKERRSSDVQSPLLSQWERVRVRALMNISRAISHALLRTNSNENITPSAAQFPLPSSFLWKEERVRSTRLFEVRVPDRIFKAASSPALARILGFCAILVVMPVAMLSPWLLRNRATYGDLTGSAVASSMLGAVFRPVRLDSVEAIRTHLSGSMDHLARTFWFGEPFPPWQRWEAPLFAINTIAIIALCGLAVYGWRLSRERNDRQWKAATLMAVAVVFHLAEVLIAPVFGGLGVVGRYLYPSVVPAIGLLWLGLFSITAEKGHRPLVAILIGGLLVLDVVNYVTYVQTSYAWG